MPHRSLDPLDPHASHSRALLRASVTLALLLLAVPMTQTATAEVKRHALQGGSTFPIARAVETTAGTTLVFHSGTTPAPAKPDAERFSAAFWGNTETQAVSVFTRLKSSLDELGLGFGDVIQMTVFLVGVPEIQGQMDFQGFMNAYTQYFGTKEQPNLPSRSAVQVAGLAAPGMLVEVEVVLARPAK